MSKKEHEFELSVAKREIFGKKLNKIRKSGLIPANIYGEGFKSQAVSINQIAFHKTFKKAKETQVVYLKIDNSKDNIPVLIHNVQHHPIDNKVIHIDFRKVDLQKKIETEVPVKFIGESEAVSQKKGVFQTISDTLLVEALPDKIPSQIEVDISNLKEVNDQIQVKSLKISTDYVFKEDPEKTIVRITEHKEEEIAPQTEAPTTEVTEQKEEVVEGEVATEGKPEEKKAEEKPVSKEAEKPKDA
ncbi:hypothetical protein A3C23_00055 [Candidatus Roizmanbacteria bacterium RIFCSPHIGHO2_02_FULL_37_13b]|uniref:Large ribosomal subunit protein bL25 n=1 Tax=Candidatus Roizmanbacteria bacterium RIFCSPLOWO2_02_FULL_36_11 TaxID=1802071 RepID=A0A1F7JHI3_9BACT|nr:MAG: hypothetical protein A3C23_00055 [Candidatus Roizmanbacteria bacterium RIFCSPHIGHO2_02_FULL_37_13b]OGK55093.1 MAG: hypothetical protein A3H78_03870 [Candidatus Roizmanbacteria bacterium RIFCSPLOWO2_02_FULL_36_11]